MDSNDTGPMVTAASVRWARQVVNADTGAMKRTASRRQRARVRRALATAHLLLDLDELPTLPHTPELDSWDVC